MPQALDTICSVSTAPGVGAIAVIRISGSQAFPITAQLFRPSTRFDEKHPNHACYAEIVDQDTLIDQVIFVKYAAPHSYDGEDMVEISCHGSVYVQERILQMLIHKGCRLAEPGEFTMRAFLNGKMDLLQAEAIGDLIDSQSERAHRLALKQLKGGFSKKIADLREQFIQLAALLELELDFSEEEVEFADRQQFLTILQELRTEVERLISSFRTGNAIKKGIAVAIAGKPNAGKSTLLNAILNDDRAIVSEVPGTTRDTVEDTLRINGNLFRFIDTAGLRHTHDEIETSGIERSFRAMEHADIIFYMVDAKTTQSATLAELGQLQDTIDLSEKQVMLLINKIDLYQDMALLGNTEIPYEKIGISAKNQWHIDQIIQWLSDRAMRYQVTDNTLLTNARHYDLMRRIADDLQQIEDGFRNDLPTDLIAIDVRCALDKLGRLTGKITDNDILNTIFGKFCIGK